MNGYGQFVAVEYLAVYSNPSGLSLLMNTLLLITTLLEGFGRRRLQWFVYIGLIARLPDKSEYELRAV